MAPILGRDLSYVTDVDPRIRVFDINDGLPPVRRHYVTSREAGPSSLSPQLVDEALAAADVLLVGFPVPETLAGRAPRLVWAHHTQAGVSNLTGSDLWTSTVTLTTSRGAVAATAIAEYVVAAASMFARGLQEATRQKAAGLLTRHGYELMTLRGSTMGVIGLGGIGREVARLSRAAGMRVIATRRSVSAPQVDAGDVDLLLPADRLLEVVARADFVAICSQLTPETRGMIGRAVFDSIKPGAVIINVARGEEIDEAAMIGAIRKGRLRGAVLDVYDGEQADQPPRAELLELPQIVLTPHISARGDTLMAEPLKRLFADNLHRFMDGRPLLNVVDRARGY